MNLVFDTLKEIFNRNKFRLFMVGSTSRDYLLNNEINDYDFVTDATPEEVKKFLDVDMTFAKFGSVKYYLNDNKIDIVTLREEGDYEDKRHPSYIKFIKDINVDYKRRDFTINAIYIDENYVVQDISKTGEEDLFNKRLRFIGEPEKRIKEDPLRILRAKRFIIEYELFIDETTKEIIHKNLYLLKYISKGKLEEENRKLEMVSGGKDYEF